MRKEKPQDVNDYAATIANELSLIDDFLWKSDLRERDEAFIVRHLQRAYRACRAIQGLTAKEE